MMKTLFLIIFLTIPSGLLFSQVYSISGIVTDSAGNPLPNINVVITGTNFGSASDKNGKYEILNLRPGSYKIEFSAIGYKSYIKDNLIIRDKTEILDVVLKKEII